MSKRIADLLGEVDRRFRRSICLFLRQRLPSLSPEDLADSWADSLAAILKKLEKSPVSAKTTAKELEPLVRKVAYRRAVDILRRNSARANALLAAAQFLQRAEIVANPTEIRDLLRQIADYTDQLPAKQRMVMDLFIRGYPATTRMKALCAAVEKESGQRTTTSAVKKNLYEVREKLRSLFSQQGY